MLETDAMITERKLLTADDVWEMGEDAHVELVRGELREGPINTVQHGCIAGGFAGHLGMHVRRSELGEILIGGTGVVVVQSPTTLLVPDLMFVKSERFTAGCIPDGFLEIPPDLVLEIRSDRLRFCDFIERMGWYLKFGVPLVWLADPARKAITAMTPDGSVRVYHSGDMLDGGDVLPGFSVPVDRLFP